jgi:hypothetical protein
VSRKREVSDEVKQDRREALDAGLDEYLAAVACGDKAGELRELDTLKALELLVPDESGVLQPGPDVAGCREQAPPRD